MNVEPTFPNLLIVIGASAGGLEPITEILAKFPQEIQATIIMAMHREPHLKDNLLAHISANNTSLMVRPARSRHRHWSFKSQHGEVVDNMRRELIHNNVASSTTNNWRNTSRCVIHDRYDS